MRRVSKSIYLSGPLRHEVNIHVAHETSKRESEIIDVRLFAVIVTLLLTIVVAIVSIVGIN